MPPPPPHDPEPQWPIPTFNIRIEDLAHPGAKLFLDHIRPDEALRNAVVTVCTWLYTPESVPRDVQCVTLVLRPMPGVAHTFGSPTHKEIHFSLDHIRNSESRAKDEILGVLVHEMVHCYQYNGQGKSPGGLIEGIADWVRLKAGHSPPHWKRETDGDWDGGYQKTAYFLEWIEGRYGDGSIRELNEAMKDKEYDEQVFKDVTGRKVSKLWKLYKAHLEELQGPAP
ncbi:plant basic secretory protein [Lentinus brumalis]|uniref:Plant basic secretory protein n=1 Tax=Lentinus brumalis TaxID=2498619 RepID=A0A371DH40_9APHY|nr:plant basic secretory protein [Polyporus brumalis]